VATEVSSDVDATLRVVGQNLAVLENQRQVTPNDPVLYCSLLFVWANKNILQHLVRLATVHQLMLKIMVDYFQLRIAVASSISHAQYDKDKAEITETLLDLYEGERARSDHTQTLLKALLKQ
jgi:hypothetical protein